MKIKVLTVGRLDTNCYLLEDEATSQAAVIDPGDEAGRILSLIEADGVTVSLILLTHGHYDHILAAGELHRRFPDAAVYVHENDAHGAGVRRSLQAVSLCASPEDSDGTDGRPATPAGLVDGLHTYGEGDELTLGGLTLRVMHTPGHSGGSVVLQAGGVLFTGDTLFAGTCGRTDLADGDMQQMLSSLKRLGELEGDYQVLPGHGHGSTLEMERRANPYMLMAAAEG